jgi:hypothetical protein
MSDSEEPTGAGDPGGGAMLLSVDRLVLHLHKIVLAVLEDEDNSGSEVLTSMLQEPSNLDLLTKFIGDNHSKSLLIERFSGKDPAKEEKDNTETTEDTEELDQVR